MWTKIQSAVLVSGRFVTRRQLPPHSCQGLSTFTKYAFCNALAPNHIFQTKCELCPRLFCGSNALFGYADYRSLFCAARKLSPQLQAPKRLFAVCSINLFLSYSGSTRFSSATRVLLIAFLVPLIHIRHEKLANSQLCSIKLGCKLIISDRAPEPVQLQNTNALFFQAAWLASERSATPCLNCQLLNKLC